MVSIAQQRLARVVQKQGRIRRLHVIVLRRFPKVVPHQQPVLIRQIVENLFRALAYPVADHGQIRIPVQPEKRLQVLARTALPRIVDAPASALADDPHAVHFDNQERFGALIFHRRNRGGVLFSGRQRIHPACGRLQNAFMPRIDHLFSGFRRLHRRIFHAPQRTGGIQQAQFICHFPNSKPQLLRVAQVSAIQNRELQMIQFRLSVTIGPPKPRMFHCCLENSLRASWCNGHLLRQLHAFKGGVHHG